MDDQEKDTAKTTRQYKTERSVKEPIQKLKRIHEDHNTSEDDGRKKRRKVDENVPNNRTLILNIINDLKNRNLTYGELLDNMIKINETYKQNNQLSEKSGEFALYLRSNYVMMLAYKISSDEPHHKKYICKQKNEIIKLLRKNRM